MSGAMARPCGAAVTSNARTNCGVAVEMSTTSTLLFAPSARYSWWEAGSATTPSNVPAATTGIAAWRTVDWQLVQAPRRTAPPAATSIGTTAAERAAAIEPAGFIHIKRARRRKYGSRRPELTATFRKLLPRRRVREGALG